MGQPGLGSRKGLQLEELEEIEQVQKRIDQSQSAKEISSAHLII